LRLKLTPASVWKRLTGRRG